LVFPIRNEFPVSDEYSKLVKYSTRVLLSRKLLGLHSPKWPTHYTRRDCSREVIGIKMVVIPVHTAVFNSYQLETISPKL